MRNQETVENIIRQVTKALHKASVQLREADRLTKESPWFSVNDETPAVDEEVIVLSETGEISFGHIVDETVAKGYDGWNISNVAFWMPFQMSDEMKEFFDEEDRK